ncbi:hypothetical protein CA54_26090 [Symmachiella macrocystis]|uniref:Uncharacterized protein n=1 Tax=Symmachiella macrocystis TaxID=2527985 RepID=A0A5C6BSU0_9PLAN|nr:hypothetical protein CA54_26090 [Symmachiella macrocystis]
MVVIALIDTSCLQFEAIHETFARTVSGFCTIL